MLQYVKTPLYVCMLDVQHMAASGPQGTQSRAAADPRKNPTNQTRLGWDGHFVCAQLRRRPPFPPRPNSRAQIDASCTHRAPSRAHRAHRAGAPRGLALDLSGWPLGWPGHMGIRLVPPATGGAGAMLGLFLAQHCEPIFGQIIAVFVNFVTKPLHPVALVKVQEVLRVSVLILL